MKKIELRSILILVLLIASLNFIKVASAEQVYYPYPIVFVHGLNSSDGMWIGMRDELRQYFREGLEYKYPTHFTELNYFIGCDYQDQNNGIIKDIAKYRLSSKINEALSLYPSSIPESERKVIIVCHSMGGLVTRSLLKEIPSYKNKIHRVVFIDTPHLGSPYASALWLFNELKNDARNDYRETMYQSYSAFSPFALMYAGFIDYPDLYFKVGNTQRHINELLFVLEQTGPRPSYPAIRDLRTPAFTYYEKIYQGFVSSIRRYKDYLGGDTFLGQNNLDIPNDYKVIVGKNPSGLATTLWNVADVFNLSEPFTFSTLAGEEQTLNNAVVNGDGIVTMSSQKLNKIDYQVNSFHVGAADAAIDETLQAIDDPPVIESVRFLKDYSDSDDLDYIIVKVKDYLLADIEITELTDVNLTTEFPDFAKPYFKYPEKGFLKERDVTIQMPDGEIQRLHLMPGEFHAKLDEKVENGNVYNIRVKNPAGKYATCQVIMPSLQVVMPSSQDNGIIKYVNFSGNSGAGFDAFRTSAIAQFSSSEVSYTYPPEVTPHENQPNIYPVVPHTWINVGGNNPILQQVYFYSSQIGGSASSDLTVSGFIGCGNSPWYSWTIQAESNVAPSLEFNLAVTKPIKSARIAGTFHFGKPENNNEDFEMSFTFPDENVSFSLNTASYQSGGKFDILIDPTYLTPNGSNAWTFSANFLEDASVIQNCFPTSYPEPIQMGGICGIPPCIPSHLIYGQSAYVDPFLMITLEEDQN